MIARYRPLGSQNRFAPLSKLQKQDNRALVKATPKPPKELADFFANPPLVGDESREVYDSVFLAIAAAAKPADAIAWIYVQDFADLTWEQQRERRLKQQVIENGRKDVITDLLMPAQIDSSLDDVDELESERDAEVERVFEEMEQWEKDPIARQRIDEQLASEGYEAAYILTTALTNCASEIDAIDKRISLYEYRRNAILREIDRYSESLARRLDKASSDMARRLDKASSDFTDGEFTDAAE